MKDSILTRAQHHGRCGWVGGSGVWVGVLGEGGGGCLHHNKICIG